jgi:hypothetical protein
MAKITPLHGSLYDIVPPHLSDEEQLFSKK